MAAPGLGVGDIVAACNYIYKRCAAYKDAVKEFDEISAKAKSTAVVVERLDMEAAKPGSLVERAGAQAYEQLQDNIRSLRVDCSNLKELIKKYEKIQEMPARRLIFSFLESDNLTDLRRRIGLHEQTLNLWYMSLVYGSLRRIESGQEVMLEVLKSLSSQKLRKVSTHLEHGDTEPLENELRKSGLAEETIQENLDIAATFVTSSPQEKSRIETEIRAQSYSGRHQGRRSAYGRYDAPRDYMASSNARGRSYANHEVEISDYRGSSHRRDPSWVRTKPSEEEHCSDIRRSKSTGSTRPSKTNTVEEEREILKRKAEMAKTETGTPIMHYDFGRYDRMPDIKDRPDLSYQLRPVRPAHSRSEGPLVVVVDEEPSPRPRRASDTGKAHVHNPIIVVPDSSSRSHNIYYHRSTSGSPRRTSDAATVETSRGIYYPRERRERPRSSSFNEEERSEKDHSRLRSTPSNHRRQRSEGSAERKDKKNY